MAQARPDPVPTGPTIGGTARACHSVRVSAQFSATDATKHRLRWPWHGVATAVGRRAVKETIGRALEAYHAGLTWPLPLPRPPTELRFGRHVSA